MKADNYSFTDGFKTLSGSDGSRYLQSQDRDINLPRVLCDCISGKFFHNCLVSGEIGKNSTLRIEQ